MIRLGFLKLGVSPALAAVFDDHVTPAAIHALKKTGVSIAELRIDCYAHCEPEYVLAQIQTLKAFPMIATIRSKKEGGAWKFSEAARFFLFKAVIPKVDAIDIELSAGKILKPVLRAARSSGTKVIVSYHNFKRTPGLYELRKVAEKARSAGADIVKVAAFVTAPKDLQALAQFTLDNAGKNIVTIGMGERGAGTRILFPMLGSLWTYASTGHSTAPGQLSVRETARLFKLFY